MPLFPILDRVGLLILLILALALSDAERGSPLRRRVDQWRRRIVVNLGIGAPSLLVFRLLLIPVVIAAALSARDHHFGLARLLPLPRIAAAFAALVVLDYSTYWWHRLTHVVPLLWRFHRVHHTDLDVDASTAFRFHFGETLLAVIVRSLQVVIAGASPTVVLAYEVMLGASTVFHHSNVKLPRSLDRFLNAFVMTPRAHGIHHSAVLRERNSNFSRGCNLWDRLHRTLCLDVRQDDIVIGLPEYREARELTLANLQTMPFRRPRGSVPWPESSTSAASLAARKRAE